MKPNPKKLSFSALAILFAASVVAVLFAGAFYAQFLPFSQLAITVVLLAVVLVPLFFKGKLHTGFNALTITDTTYAGEFYDIFLMKMVTGFETARKGLIKVQTGIKKKGTVGRLDVDSFIQAEQDPPVFGANVGVGSRVLVPDPAMGYLTADPKVFEDHWEAVKMNPALLDRALPVTFESALVNRIAELNQNWMDLIFWRGSKDTVAIATAIASGLGPTDNNLIFTDGIVKITKAALAAGNKIVAPTAVVLTSGNIVSKFADLKALIMASVDGPAAYNDPNFVFIVNYKTGSLYGDAVKAQANKGDDFTGKGKREYDGKPIIEVFGMHDDTIWAGVATRDERSQLWLGCNEADEDTKFRVGKLQNNSEKIFVKMLTKFCTQIAVPEQVFLYTTK